MRHICTILTLILLLTVSTVIGQSTDQDTLTGTYGAYMDISTFTELTLNDDYTFKYYDQFELGGTFEYYGKWKDKGHKIILYDSENNTIRPMPTKWKIKDNELISEKVNNVSTGVKSKVVLTYNKKK